MAVYTTVNDPSVYFQTQIYTGTGSLNSVTNSGNANLQPDWLWIKNRSAGWSNILFDSSRGTGKSLFSDSSDPEVTNNSRGYASAFNADGFTVGAGSAGSDNVNTNSQNYVAWQWKANAGTTATNNVGSIQSTVQVNSTSNFSIVRWTGNGNSSTNIGHGLGVAPKMVIVKNLSENRDWGVWAKPIWDTNNAGRMYLNLTDQIQTSSGSPWFQNLNTTASQFYVGDSINTNGNGDSMLAYCFCDVQGYSKIGKYGGNGNGNGPFIYTGFKPAFLMVKRMDSANDWWIIDDKRDDYQNPFSDLLLANTGAAENANTARGDLLSNGFKWRVSANAFNATGGSYLYMAFASSPFVTSDGVPTTAK